MSYVRTVLEREWGRAAKDSAQPSPGVRERCGALRSVIRWFAMGGRARQPAQQLACIGPPGPSFCVRLPRFIKKRA